MRVAATRQHGSCDKLRLENRSPACRGLGPDGGGPPWLRAVLPEPQRNSRDQTPENFAAPGYKASASGSTALPSAVGAQPLGQLSRTPGTAQPRARGPCPRAAAAGPGAVLGSAGAAAAGMALPRALSPAALPGAASGTETREPRTGRDPTPLPSAAQPALTCGRDQLALAELRRVRVHGAGSAGPPLAGRSRARSGGALPAPSPRRRSGRPAERHWLRAERGRAGAPGAEAAGARPGAAPAPRLTRAGLRGPGQLPRQRCRAQKYRNDGPVHCHRISRLSSPSLLLWASLSVSLSLFPYSVSFTISPQKLEERKPTGKCQLLLGISAQKNNESLSSVAS